MKKPAQRAMHCRCGNAKIIAHGLCWTCYSLKRQYEAYFGGLREEVLERDGHLCRVCAELPEVDRLCAGQPPSVHHRVPGISKLHLMITLCAAHHAQVGRLQLQRSRCPRCFWYCGVSSTRKVMNKPCSGSTRNSRFLSRSHSSPAKTRHKALSYIGIRLHGYIATRQLGQI